MGLVYLKDLRNAGTKTFPSDAPNGYNAGVHNVSQVEQFRSVQVSAHQGYTSNADSSKHWVTDDSHVPTGKLQRWSDNGGAWTEDAANNDILGDINALGGDFTFVDHVGGCSLKESGDGVIIIALNKDIGDTYNTIAKFNATSLALIDATLITGTAVDSNSCAYYNNEIYMASFTGNGVAVFDYETVTFKREITFDPKYPYPQGVNGIFVDSTGIYLSASKTFPHYSLTGDYIAGVHHDNGVNPLSPFGTNDTGGAEDLHIHDGKLRVLFDGGSGNPSHVKYFDAPLNSRGTSDSDGYTCANGSAGDQSSGIRVLDDSGALMPTQLTIIMRVRFNRFFNAPTSGADVNNYGNQIFGNARSRYHHRCCAEADGIVRFYPHSNTQILSTSALNADQFYDIALVWDQPNNRYNMYIDGVAVGADRTGSWSGQQLYYGFGAFGEYPEVTESEATFQWVAIYDEAKDDAFLTSFNWPITDAEGGSANQNIGFFQ